MDKEELNGIMEYEYKRVTTGESKQILDFGIQIKIENDDYTKWEITMKAPDDSDYKGAKYTLIAEFQLEYPLTNPIFKFKSDFYHCNVDKEGNLKVNWLLKGMKIDYILPRLLTLFYLQDTEAYKDSERSKLYENDKEQFMENVKKNVEENKCDD